MKNEKALETLRAGLLKISTSDEFQAYLKTAAKFHKYSLHNAMLIGVQRPTASAVMGFNGWKDLGRFVKRGEKGIAIFAPIIVKKLDSLTGTKKDSLVGFKTVYVFDVQQTDGKPLPEPVMPVELKGDEGAPIFGALTDFAQHGGLTVLPEFADFSDDRKGDYSPAAKQIRIRAGMDMMQRTKTMAHECAHWVLHTSPEGAALPREIKETEAEAAAFLALAEFGMPTDGYSFAYIAHWAQGDVSLLEKSLGRIQKAVAEIVHAIRSRLTPEAV